MKRKVATAEFVKTYYNTAMKVSSTAIKKIILHRLFPVFLACLLAFSLRLYRLEHPQKLYFDEVYHGFTALEYARNNAAAYDPWATPPKGFAYEWTHPPLAKMIMAGSVAVLGPNSLAWRLPPAIFGSLSILLAALIADELFRSSKIAILTAYFLTLDGLNFVMSRLAMNDTTFICFMLAAILAYLKSKKANSERQSYWLVVSGISLGLALASKWTTLYVFGLLGCDQLITWWHQKKLPSVQQFLLLCLTLGGIPILVYLLSYLHYFALGYTWENFVELQKSNVVVPHQTFGDAWLPIPTVAVGAKCSTGLVLFRFFVHNCRKYLCIRQSRIFLDRAGCRIGDHMGTDKN